MQKKSVKKIIQSLDQIIYRALNNGYNAHTSKLSFSETKIIQPDDSGLIYSKDDIILKISDGNTIMPITRVNYRIPQTKIYLTFIQNDDYAIRIIHYFDQIVLIAEYYKSDAKHLIELKSINNPLIMQFPKNETLTGKYIKLSAGHIYIAQVSNSPVVNPEDLPDYIAKCIKEEIKSHPLSEIQTDDIDYLKEVDQNWSLLSVIRENHKISIDDLVSDNFSDILWIQEIYLQLGWFDQLSNFYNEVSKISLSPQQIKIIASALCKFNHACELFGRMGIQLKFSETESEKEFDGQLLNCFINSNGQQDDTLYELIQHSWNYLHIPALRLKFQQLIIENPDEYIALGILALQYRFWWYAELEDVLVTFLPEKKRIVYKLVTLINKMNTIRYQKDSIYYSKYYPTDRSNSQIRINNALIKKDTSRNQVQYSSLEKENIFFIRINQAADFEYVPNSNQIKVWPRVFNPTKYISINCAIDINDITVHVPIIWDQFTIEFNKCRFKFLRKKDRFQVTIKFANSVSEIRLNKQIILNTNGPVKKYYMPIKRSNSEVNVSAYNRYGAKLKNPHFSSENIVLKGIGFNIFGIMNGNFKFHPDGQKKNFDIDLTSNENKPIYFNPNIPGFKLTASKFDPVKLAIGHSDPFIVKLLNTNISKLFHKLKIYVNENDIDMSDLVSLCIKNLGFIPSIGKTSELIADKNHLICIISNSIGDKNINREVRYEITSINNKTRQTALWINPNQLSYLFSEAFFTSFYG